ncbi:MAG: hypothetical protein CXZ00_00525 [Acidobacteria bacterium]|nr:MAG: hypothetical protein CXZ00_00525 [Acidobacteriota bacterium]
MNAGTWSNRLLAILQELPRRAGKEDVHRLRTTVRRLEVLLDRCPTKVAKALKSLRKGAGKVRDIDVHVGLLKHALFSKTSANCDAKFQLLKILKARRDRQLRSLREVIAEFAPKLVEKLPVLAGSAAKRKGGARTAHARVARACERYMQWTRNGIPEDEQQLHRLRINSKKLRYLLEPLEKFEEAAEAVAKFKHVQDAIGAWHDWTTLAQLAERKLNSPDAEPMRAALRARTGREYRKARRAAEDVQNWIRTEHAVPSERGNKPHLVVPKAV